MHGIDLSLIFVDAAIYLDNRRIGNPTRGFGNHFQFARTWLKRTAVYAEKEELRWHDEVFLANNAINGIIELNLLDRDGRKLQTYKDLSEELNSIAQRMGRAQRRKKYHESDDLLRDICTQLSKLFA
ncbi:MAG: hypothetical protein NTW79_00165 [Candidatus Berkelbacteria bacterium]|nr:hypothetical protein [Candidatus Berkelbacteria bacterium]